MELLNNKRLTVAVLVSIGLVLAFKSAFRRAESLSNMTHRSPAAREMSLPYNYTNGYMLQLNVRAQMTGSAMNVLSMQCMFSHLSSKLLIVEPFIIHSTFGVTLTEDQEKFDILNNLKLGDIYDWNSMYTQGLHYHHFASWEDFIKKAPRDVILMSSDSNCESHMEPLIERYSGFFKKFDFRVVRTACVKLNTLTTNEFTEVVYGNYAIEATSLVMTSQTMRVQTLFHTDSGGIYEDCDKRKSSKIVVTRLLHSEKVRADASKYITKYLGGNTNYVSVMVRLEKFLKDISGSSPAVKATEVKQVFQDIIDKWSDVKKEIKIESTFFTVDIGKYGSIVFTWKKTVTSMHVNMTLVQSEVYKLFDRFYKGNMSFTEWENSFESVSSVTQPTEIQNYVGILQKEIASRGRCLIQFGGNTLSSFQIHAANMFSRNHGEDDCLRKLTPSRSV